MNDRSTTFRQFLIDEMKRRDMSNRQFADLVGVSNSTINRAVDAKKPTQPTLDFLVKLSKTTSTSLFTLIEMAYPDVTDESKVNPSTQVLAQRIERLPEHIQEALMSLIRSYED